MVRHPFFLRALVAVIGLSPLALGAVATPVPAAASAPAAAYDAPLAVSIDSMTPAYVPEQGRIRITGTVTNRDDVTWTTINLYPTFGDDLEPMRSVAELAAAAELDPDAYVGERLIDDGERSDKVAELAPGASSSFSVSVPRSVVEVTEAGVYWFGVHALGESESTLRDDFADGRARTFLPYVPPRITDATPTSIVIPLRRYLPYAPDGSMDQLDEWEKTLSEGGALHELVDFAASTGGREVSWLVDPALLDAVRRIAGGNRPRSLAPTAVPDPEESTESPSGSPDADFEDDTEGEPEADPLPAEVEAPAAAAAAWLEDLEATMSGDEILTLPYGNLDVAAAVEHDPDLYDLTQAQSGKVLEEWGFPTVPAVGSPSGYIDAAGIAAGDPGHVVLVTDQMFPGRAPGVATTGDHRLVVTSSGSPVGGPGPGGRLSAVGLRQRILSEAAVRLLAPDQRPLVVVLPRRWDLAGADEFFAGLDPDWLDLDSVDEAASGPAVPVDAEQLDYPESQARRELDADIFDAVGELISSGDTLQNLLTRNDEIASVVTEQALTSASYAARESPTAARATVNGSRSWIEAQLGSVRISAPPGVTLSSAEGDFAATISNDLDEPVTVSVGAESSSGITVAPPELIELGPGSRTTVLLEARTSSIAVNNVTLLVTDTSGTPLGSSDELPIRSAQVSNVIWVIMGTGVGLLFLAILVRLVRRVRGGARTDEQAPLPSDAVADVVPPEPAEPRP